MKIIEGLFSLVVFLSLLPLMPLSQIPKVETSVYDYQLANDAWRVLYLNGDIESLDYGGIKEDLEEISRQTSLCFSIVLDEEVSSCNEPSEEKIVLKKTVIINEKPRTVEFYVWKSD